MSQPILINELYKKYGLDIRAQQKGTNKHQTNFEKGEYENTPFHQPDSLYRALMQFRQQLSPTTQLSTQHLIRDLWNASYGMYSEDYNSNNPLHAAIGDLFSDIITTQQENLTNTDSLSLTTIYDAWLFPELCDVPHRDTEESECD